MFDPKLINQVLTSARPPKDTNEAKAYFRNALPPPLANVMCDVVEQQRLHRMGMHNILDASGRILEALDQMQRDGMMTEEQRNFAVRGVVDSLPPGLVLYDGIDLFKGSGL